MFSKKIKVNAVATAGQICINLGKAGYDQKTLSAFLTQFEAVMMGAKE